MQSTLWRVAALDPWSGDLAINALHLYAGAARIDEQAVLTSSVAPVSGSLQNIALAAPGAGAVFGSTSVKESGFFLQWEFASAVAVGGFRVAGADLSAFSVFAWSGERWILVRDVRGLKLSRTSLTPVLPFVVREAITGASLCFKGDATQDGVTGVNWSIPSGAVIQEEINRGGASTLFMSGSLSASYPSAAPAFTNWTGADITIEANVFFETPPTGDSDLPLMIFCGESAPGTVYWSFGPGIDNSLRFYYWSGSQNSFKTPAGVVNRSRLMHIAVSIQGAVVRFFVGGKLVHTATRATSPIGGGNAWPLRIGCTRGAVGDLVKAGVFAVSDVIFTPFAKYTTDFTLGEQWDSDSRLLVNASRQSTAASAQMPSFSTAVSKVHPACDVELGGRGSLYGVVSDFESKQWLQRRVRLFRSCDGLLARESWSAADGTFRFDGINERYEYDIEAWDHEKNFFSTVANNQLPEVAA